MIRQSRSFLFYIYIKMLRSVQVSSVQERLSNPAHKQKLMATFFKKSYFRFAFSLPIKSTICYHFLSASTVAKVRSLTGKIQIECFMYLTVRLRQVLSFQKQNDRDISQVVFYFEYYQTAQIGADFVRARETERPCSQAKAHGDFL